MTEWSPDQISWLERRFLKLLGEMRLHNFQHNYKVELPDQNKEFYIDFANPTIMLGFEVDSRKYHSTQFAKDHDEWRQQLLEDAGWTIIRFRSEEILRKPDLVKNRVRAAVGKTATKTLDTLNSESSSN